jgi:hypothetical protein
VCERIQSFFACASCLHTNKMPARSLDCRELLLSPLPRCEKKHTCCIGADWRIRVSAFGRDSRVATTRSLARRPPEPAVCSDTDRRRRSLRTIMTDSYGTFSAAAAAATARGAGFSHDITGKFIKVSAADGGALASVHVCGGSPLPHRRRRHTHARAKHGSAQ